MNLKTLTHQQLNENMMSLASQERALLAEVLLCIKEIDQRKLYATFLAYGSLFDYLTKHCGYSPGSAQRRIDAARLMTDVPEVALRIESGELTLSQVSHVQKAIRQLKKESRNVSKQDKQELVQSLFGLSDSESQQQVAKTLDLEIKETPKVAYQADSSVRIEMTFTREQWELLQEAKNILSHQVPDGDLSQVITEMSQLTIKQRREVVLKTKAICNPKQSQKRRSDLINSKELNDSKQQTTRKKSTGTKNGVKVRATATTLPAVRQNKTRTPKTTKIILSRDKCCVYRDPITGRQCKSKWQLQIDHKQPRWANGGHEQSNLQVLCRTHNLVKYMLEARLLNLQRR